MTEQQTPDREKKIAEIREALEAAKHYDFSSFDNIMRPVYVVCSNAPEWLRFLLSELDRLEREYAEERAAHNAHVTELCELEQENRKQFDRIVELTNCIKQITGDLTPAEFVAELIANQTEFRRTMDELQSAQQEIERYKQFEQQYNEFKKSWEKYQQGRDKLIEGLRFYERLARGREINDGGRRARTLLAEIGVNVE